MTEALNVEPAIFEIEALFEIRGRGAILLGQVRSGVFRIGMRVSGQPGFEPLTIAGIDFADRRADRTVRIGLSFRERPDLASARAQFPVGALLKRFMSE